MQEEEIKDLMETIGELNSRISELEEELKESEDKVSDLEDDIENKDREISDLEDTITELEKTIEVLEDETRRIFDKDSLENQYKFEAFLEYYEKYTSLEFEKLLKDGLTR